MNIFILDCSAVMSFLLTDEKTPQFIHRIFVEYQEKKCEFKAPIILPVEVTNALKNSVIQKRLTDKLAQALLLQFLSWTIYYETIALSDVLSLSIETKLSVYDAMYVYISKKLNAPLLTLDKQLEKFSR